MACSFRPLLHVYLDFALEQGKKGFYKHLPSKTDHVYPEFSEPKTHDGSTVYSGHRYEKRKVHELKVDV